MKKILIIASLAIIATPSMAKTKVYGELHASFDKVFDVGEKSRHEFALNDSFLGFKGSYEIKKDVSFIYQFVWGVNSNNFDNADDSGFDNRNQVIGLASPKGAVIIGRFDTPFKIVGKKADLFWHSQLGQNRNITNALNWDLRADKIIAFQSPKMNGFQGTVAYASDIADTSRVTENASAISVNGFYKKGKYLFGAAYEHHDLDNISASRNALRLSTHYKNGPFKFTGFYQNENNNINATSKRDASVFGVGAAYRKGKATFKTQLYKRDIDAVSEDSNLIALGYDYKLSKELDVYTQIAKITHAANLSRTEFGTLTSITNNDVHGFSLGIRYKF